jgi:hypothetical protein
MLDSSAPIMSNAVIHSNLVADGIAALLAADKRLRVFYRGLGNEWTLSKEAQAGRPKSRD